jgi:hypothetical protein
MVEYMADDSKTEDTFPEPESLVPPTPNLGLEDVEVVQKRKEVREFVIGLLIGMFVVIPVAFVVDICIAAPLLMENGGTIGLIVGLGLYIGAAQYVKSLGFPHASKGIYLALLMDVALVCCILAF